MVSLWKQSPTGFILHGTFSLNTTGPNPLISQNGELLATYGSRTIQLWRGMKGLLAASSRTFTQTSQDFLLDFCPDLALAVTVVHESGVIMVLDLNTGVPQSTIDTGADHILGLRVVNNSVVVVLGSWGIQEWGSRDWKGKVRLVSPHRWYPRCQGGSQGLLLGSGSQ